MGGVEQRSAVVRHRRRKLKVIDGITDTVDDKESNGGAPHSSPEGEAQGPSLMGLESRVGSCSSFRNIPKWFVVSFCLIHFMAVTLLAVGIYARTQWLHNGSECTMTYSRRVFVPLDDVHSVMSASAPSPANDTDVFATSDMQRYYKLYKFVDQRDPRYQHLLKTGGKNPNRDWCSGGVPKVLYIPGHWGSYEQSRSIGAHGIQMTGSRISAADTRRAQAKLLNSVPKTSSQNTTISLEGFIYDVYAVDFAEQGAALHGQFIVEQAHFVARAIRFLMDSCDGPTPGKPDPDESSTLTSLVVVAHSMGGIVAHMVPILYPELQHAMKYMVLLASPLSNPLYGFDKSVHDIYKQIRQHIYQYGRRENSNYMVVSISGGLRDEMIPPESSAYQKLFEGERNTNSMPFVSLLSTDVMLRQHNGQHRPRLGMDHRAIVWCYEVLATGVREVIWMLLANDNSSSQARKRGIWERYVGSSENRTIKLSQSQDYHSDHYHRSLDNMHVRLEKDYGLLYAALMRTAMIYNLPYLLVHNTIISVTELAFSSTMLALTPELTLFVPPGASILLGYIYSDLCLVSVIILALVANAVRLCLLFALSCLAKHQSDYSSKPSLRDSTSRFVGLFCATVVVEKIAFRIFSSDLTALRLDSYAYLTTTLAAYQIMYWMLKDNSSGSGLSLEQSQTLTLIAMAMITLPFNIVGSVCLLLWNRSTEWSSWTLLLKLVLPIVALYTYQRFESSNRARILSHPNPRRLLRLPRRRISRVVTLGMLILFYAPLLFERGAFFRSGQMISYVFCSEILSLACS